MGDEIVQQENDHGSCAVPADPSDCIACDICPDPCSGTSILNSFAETCVSTSGDGQNPSDGNTVSTTPVQTGASSVHIGYNSNGALNWGSEYYTSSPACARIPLKCGGVLSLRWTQIEALGGIPAEWDSSMNDYWRPGGRGGAFDFLPMVMRQSSLNTADKIIVRDRQWTRRWIYSSGAYASPGPLSYKFTLNKTTEYFFREDDLQRRTYFIYGAQGTITSPSGRPVKRFDNNGNVLTYVYLPKPSGTGHVLHTITGDIGKVQPYFMYKAATGTQKPDDVPIRKIFLLDTANAANSRTIYYNYTDEIVKATDGLSRPQMNSITFPGGCTTGYRIACVGLKPHNLDTQYFDHPTIYKEQDADGYTTYYEYENPDPHDYFLYHRFRKVSEPEGKVTYFTFDKVNKVTQVTQQGRPAVTYRYATAYGAIPQLSAKTDALGNTTYYNWNFTLPGGSTKADKPSKRVSASGRIEYFEYNGQSSLRKYIDVGNGSTTYYLYNANGRDLYARVGPRNSSSFPQITYFAYNATRNNTSTRDALGNTWTSNRDSRGRIRQTGDPLGNLTYYRFDDATGFTTAMLDAALKSSYYKYDSFGNPTRRVSPRWQETGSFASFTTYHNYDQRDRPIKTIDALGRSSYFEYTNRGSTKVATDPRGVVRQYRYNGFKLKTKEFIQTASGATVWQNYYNYDTYKNCTRNTDALFNTTYYFFDAKDRQVAKRDPIGNPTYFFYDAMDKRTRVRDAKANTTYFRYDTLGRITSIRDAIGNASYFFYDTASNRTSTRDARQNITTYVYDALNRVRAAVDALSNPTYFFFDAAGNRTRIRDTRVNTTYFFYDSLNRVSRVRDALARSSYFFYDAASNRTRIRDARANTTYFFYDAIDQRTRTRDALANPTYYFYDAVGNRTRVRDARGNTDYFFYDALNRPIVIRNALAQANYFFYDAIGNITRQRDPLSHATYYTYDAVNRVSNIRDALGNTVAFGYDSVGNRRVEQDQRGNASYFAYDQLNRLSQALDPLGMASNWSYDPNSNLAKSVDANGAPIYFVYDGMNRRTRIVYAGVGGYGIQSYGITPYGGGSGSTQYFEYDSVGNLTKTIDGWGTSTFSYDTVNRLLSRTTARNDSLYFGYDSVSNLTLLRYPGGVSAQATASFDALNRMSQIISPNATAHLTYFAYNVVNQRTKRLYGNRTSCYYLYDNANRISKIRHRNTSGQPIVYFDYQRDADGRIVTVSRESDLAIYYQYDSADRLTKEIWSKRSSHAQIYAFSYVYDAAGNRTKGFREAAAGVTLDASYYRYNATNAVTKRYVTPANTATYYIYDANGALVQLIDGTKLTYFVYGPNQLISRIQPPAADGSPWYFMYDGLLNRVKILKGSTPVYYLWNGMNQLEERDAAGALKARYTHGPGIVSGVGSVVEVERHTATTTYYQYLHMDQQGSVVAVTDQNQGTQLQYTNDAFGRQIVSPSGSGTAVPNDFQFQSNWFTFTIGTRRYGMSPSRVYDPELGRFLQSDQLPTLTKLVRGVDGNVLGIYSRTALASEVLFQEAAQRTIPHQVNAYGPYATVNGYDASGFDGGDGGSGSSSGGGIPVTTPGGTQVTTQSGIPVTTQPPPPPPAPPPPGPPPILGPPSSLRPPYTPEETPPTTLTGLPDYCEEKIKEGWRRATTPPGPEWRFGVSGGQGTPVAPPGTPGAKEGFYGAATLKKDW